MEAARDLCERMVERFHDPGEGFFDSSSAQLPMRARNLYDGAVPSGTAAACELLLRLAGACERDDWADIARVTLERHGTMLEEAPMAAGAAARTGAGRARGGSGGPVGAGQRRAVGCRAVGFRAAGHAGPWLARIDTAAQRTRCRRSLPVPARQLRAAGVVYRGATLAVGAVWSAVNHRMAQALGQRCKSVDAAAAARMASALLGRLCEDSRRHVLNGVAAALRATQVGSLMLGDMFDMLKNIAALRATVLVRRHGTAPS